MNFDPIPGLPVEEELGRGGTASVYLSRKRVVEETAAGRRVEMQPVAVKVFTKEISAHPFFRLVFEAETRKFMSLRHPNVVKVYDLGLWRDKFYLIMEYVNGVTLENHVSAAGGLLSEYESLTILRGIASGLGAVRQFCGQAHHDIKPLNVIMDGSRPVLLDFDFSASEFLQNAGDDVVWASVFFAARELLSGRKSDFHGDMYSLGCVLHFMAAGRPPFWTTETRNLPPDELVKLITTQRRPPGFNLPDGGVRTLFSPGCVQILRTCLNKTPALRYHDYGEMVAAIDAELARFAKTG